MACRVDAYENVVSLAAKDKSLCAFDVDHKFPWRRGGLSVPANLMALHWGVNRHVKTARWQSIVVPAIHQDSPDVQDWPPSCALPRYQWHTGMLHLQILHALTDEEANKMHCGLSIDQFLAVLARRDSISRQELSEMCPLPAHDAPNMHHDAWQPDGEI